MQVPQLWTPADVVGLSSKNCNSGWECPNICRQFRGKLGKWFKRMLVQMSQCCKWVIADERNNASTLIGCSSNTKCTTDLKGDQPMHTSSFERVIWPNNVFVTLIDNVSECHRRRDIKSEPLRHKFHNFIFFLKRVINYSPHSEGKHQVRYEEHT